MLNKLKTSFKSNPFPHMVVDEFMKKKELDKLLILLGNVNFHEKSSDLFHFRQSDDLKANKIFSPFHKALKELIPDLEEKSGLSLNGEIDLHATVYQDTDYLLCHDDRLDNRKIAFILYLTTLSKKDGGELALFSSENGRPKAIEKRILPKENTCVFFKVSQKSYHEVLEVLGQKPRIAIGGWFHGN